jgi:uncharacterized protein (TIGR02246 family)
MQSRCWIVHFTFALSVVFAVPQAWAQPENEVAEATAKWAEVFAENNPDTIVALYAEDGVLWGTLSSTVRSEPAEVRDYFERAFQALPNAKVEFGEQLIRVYDNTAINTGYYTFSYTGNGEVKNIPARYSFTYVKDGDEWKIVDHHSSAVPE